MIRKNRKSGMVLTPDVFKYLHNALQSKFKDYFKVSPETFVDYQLYGFNNYDEELPSIKKLVYEITGKWVNGKYLYNKSREWSKGVTSIQFTREFTYIYFQVLGYRDVHAFINQSALSKSAVSQQISLENHLENEMPFEYYVGYYLGEDENIIYTRLTIKERTQSVQLSLLYWERETDISEYNYHGKILFQQNGMSFFFKNEDTILDRSQFICIYSERQIKVKPFLVGAYAGYDRDRQPVIGEMLFQRVNNEQEQRKLTERKSINPVIAQHLSTRRWVINSRMPQSLSDLSPQSKFAEIIELFIGVYRGVFVSLENGVFIIELTMSDNLGNASLRLAGHPIYKGNFKVQASGQLLVSQFENATTKAPLFMSLEVLPLHNNIYTGDLLGISRFDKSFSGKIYISVDDSFKINIPPYRGLELSDEEIQHLPRSLVNLLNDDFSNTKVSQQIESFNDSKQSHYLHSLKGSYVMDVQKSSGERYMLTIQETGEVMLESAYKVYKGMSTLCEAGVISIYFKLCNGIQNCSQLLFKMNSRPLKNKKQIVASWHRLDDDFQAVTSQVILVKAEA